MSVPPPVRLDIANDEGRASDGSAIVRAGLRNGMPSLSCSASASSVPESDSQVIEGAYSKCMDRADVKTASRPWRKSAGECIAERRRAAAVLGGQSTISTRCVRRVMEVQELIDGKGGDAPGALQASVTVLLQAATNNRPEPEVTEARARMESLLEQHGLGEAAARHSIRQTEASRSVVTKLQLMHQVMPRLWVGGWAALNNDCAALRARKVTHVVSLVSGEKRRLPKFIVGHHYVQVDDREQAASTMASHFPQIVLFIDEARNSGGVVYVHCGAGISRAPTAAAAYLVWKLGLSALDALAVVRSNRSCARPNVGFVSSLKQWAAAPRAPAAAAPHAPAAAAPHATADVAGSTRAKDLLTAPRGSAQQEQHDAPQCIRSVQSSASNSDTTDQLTRGVGDGTGAGQRDLGCLLPEASEI